MHKIREGRRGEERRGEGRRRRIIIPHLVDTLKDHLGGSRFFLAKKALTKMGKCLLKQSDPLKTLTFRKRKQSLKVLNFDGVIGYYGLYREFSGILKQADLRSAVVLIVVCWLYILNWRGRWNL